MYAFVKLFAERKMTELQASEQTMGKLLSLLARDDSNCCSPQKYDVFLDFESEWIVQIIVTESEHDKILVLTTVLNLNLNANAKCKFQD